MPVYTYRCEHCGVQFDRHQKFSDDPLEICPECEEPALRKLIQPVGIVFKGSGFYVTDNRGASNGGRESTVSSSTKEETKSESSEKGQAEKKGTSED